MAFRLCDRSHLHHLPILAISKEFSCLLEQVVWKNFARELGYLIVKKLFTLLQPMFYGDCFNLEGEDIMFG